MGGRGREGGRRGNREGQRGSWGLEAKLLPSNVVGKQA